MSIPSMLTDAKDALQELLRKHKFKKANDNREAAAQLQADLAKCRGRLETCKEDFDHIIRTQTAYIAEGEAGGHDVAIQEQTLKEAAVGYLLVRDAIYALKSISTHDSVTHAYDVLNAAVEQMTGKSKRLLRLPQFYIAKERNEYGYITSQTALQQKTEMVEGFFATLKETGDIEACLNGAKNAEMNAAQRRQAVSGGAALADDAAELAARLSGISDAPQDIEITADDLDQMKDIHSN